MVIARRHRHAGIIQDQRLGSQIEQARGKLEVEFAGVVRLTRVPRADHLGYRSCRERVFAAFYDLGGAAEHRGPGLRIAVHERVGADRATGCQD